MSRTALSVPRWAIVASFILSLLGLGLSIYLTIAHYEGTQILACSESCLFNCAKVTTSGESRFLGIPVALLGLGNFIVMTGLKSRRGWRAKSYWRPVASFVLAIGAMIFVLWLVSAELLISTISVI